MSEVELDCELNQSRVVASRVDAAKIAGASIRDDLPGTWIDGCGRDCIEVADWVGKVHVIEEIEKLGV